jgi:Zn-finger nucleic acid-binding protein
MLIERDNFIIYEIDKDNEIEIEIECDYNNSHSIWLTKDEIIKIANHITQQPLLGSPDGSPKLCPKCNYESTTLYIKDLGIEKCHRCEHNFR